MRDKYLPTADMDADFVNCVREALATGAKITFTLGGRKFKILNILSPDKGKEHMIIRPAGVARRG